MTKTHHKFYCGDVLQVLRNLPGESVHCCITSPPYWGLRDYGISGQYGLEATPEEYIERMVDVFREVKRVLRTDGTLWLNLGDTYSQDTKWGGKSGQKNRSSVIGGYQTCRNLRTNSGLKPKDLVGIPWRVAFALQADGWYLRSDIIWHKPNSMPESVADRPTKAHEYIFLLSKSEHYYYDADAIREPHKDENFGSTWDGERVRGYPSGAKHSMVPEQMCHPRGRNKRTVWTVATQPFPDAHFATFPPKIIEPCILAGTSAKVCPKCGAPWERIRERTGHINRREAAHVPNSAPTKTDSTGWAPTSQGTDEFRPACKCPVNDGSEPGGGDSRSFWWRRNDNPGSQKAGSQQHIRRSEP